MGSVYDGAPALCGFNRSVAPEAHHATVSSHRVGGWTFGEELRPVKILRPRARACHQRMGGGLQPSTHGG